VCERVAGAAVDVPTPSLDEREYERRAKPYLGTAYTGSEPND